MENVTSTPLRIFRDFLLIIMLVVFFNFKFHENLFQRDIGTIICVIGLAWFMGSFFTLFNVKLYECSFISMLLATIVAITGAIISDPMPILTDEDMGGDPYVEWTIRIYYKEYGLEESKGFKFIGNFEESKEAEIAIIEKWNVDHPDQQVIKHTKNIEWIPPQHAQKIKADLNYTKRL